MTTTIHLTQKTTSAQVVETSLTTTDNSPSQDYTHPDDQTTLLQNIHTVFVYTNRMKWRAQKTHISTFQGVIRTMFSTSVSQTIIAG